MRKILGSFVAISGVVQQSFLVGEKPLRVE